MQRRTLAAAGRLALAVEAPGLLRRDAPGALYRQGVEEQRHNRELAGRLWRLLKARVVTAILDQVDMDAIADRIDVDRVLDRIDLDRIAERLDVNAIVQRVDLLQLTRQAMDEIEMGEIIRESTSGLAEESVEALRVQGMDADRWVSGLVDRLLMRRDERRVWLDR